MSVVVGERLRRVRKHLGETQKSMSRRFGLGESTWQTYELQDQLPKGEILASLVELGFDGSWLLTGQGRMPAAGMPAAGGNGDGEGGDEDGDARRRIWNVAFYLARESDAVQADPTAFADTFVSLHDYLSAEAAPEPAVAEGEGVVDIASARWARPDSTRNEAEAGGTSSARRLVWNVAYHVASRPGLVNAEPERFAELFGSLHDYLARSTGEAVSDEAQAAIIDFATASLLRSGSTGG